MSHESTIAAISSGPGAAQRALIRLSGPLARSITQACCSRSQEPLALERRGAIRARLDDGTGTQPVLVLWMPAPASFTGEDVVEWHLCGSPPLLRAALRRAVSLGAVLAQPGEFTRRAFENGRIDLSRAEGVLALVAARNESERRAASALLLGGLSARVDALRAAFVGVRALCEASLDFDENETGGIPRDEFVDPLRELRARLDEALAWEIAREAPVGLPRAVLVGRPNAGKSSLFNRLTDASALVSELPGTTRDALRRGWATPGGEVELWDAAGTDLVGDEHVPLEADRLARERARELRAGADLWLWIVDASLAEVDLSEQFRALSGAGPCPPTVLVLHKLDAAAPMRLRAFEQAAAGGLAASLRAVVAVSSRTGHGLAELSSAAGAVLLETAPEGEIRELSARHRGALGAAREWAVEALGLLEAGATLDLAAAALRSATDELDQIQGRTTPEDLLSAIFERFCLGK